MADGLELTLNQGSPMSLDVSIVVEGGETLALLGPSGAGKTTILRAIAGLHRGATGQVRCANQIWLDTAAAINLPARQRRVGYVFQSYALFPHLTAAQNVAEAMLNRPVAARRDAARKLLKQMHLEGLEDRRPSELSGGQKQRVALARALAREPAVLLLDEPFSAVDRPTRRALREIITDLRAVINIPMIIVTHDLDDAVQIADTLCILDSGQILQSGRTADVLASPASPLVSAMLM